MKASQSFTPAVSQEPVLEPYRHIQFLPCQRCMAHGQFMTVPADETPFVVFAQDEAFFYIGMLNQTGRISMNQFWELIRQIMHSSLPRTISQTVKEIVASEMGSWNTLDELVSIGQGTQARIRVYGVDMIDVIHRKVLALPGNEHLLRLQ